MHAWHASVLNRLGRIASCRCMQAQAWHRHQSALNWTDQQTFSDKGKKGISFTSSHTMDTHQNRRCYPWRSNSGEKHMTGKRKEREKTLSTHCTETRSESNNSYLHFAWKFKFFDAWAGEGQQGAPQCTAPVTVLVAARVKEATECSVYANVTAKQSELHTSKASQTHSPRAWFAWKAESHCQHRKEGSHTTCHQEREVQHTMKRLINRSSSISITQCHHTSIESMRTTTLNSSR